MKRENTNKIRFILEEIIPPIIRDSFIFKFITTKVMKNKNLENFKSNIINMDHKEYKNIYKNLEVLHENSDLSKVCIDMILKKVKHKSVIDVGCGDGFLLSKVKEKFPNISLSGIEMNPTQAIRKKLKHKGIKLIKLKIEKLDNIKHKYDTVICTHVLEHILDINKAYDNLKKICKRTLIIVIPKERPYKYGFNAHIHFFPYEWSFINTIRPTNSFKIQELERDFIYIEKIKN
tara:strand:- start:1 stop:699 length:699 start_codon:yes stop_codon:yes gene_type:complete